jgi:hypothetical protein
LIATEWNEFRTPDFEKIASPLKSKLIFDGRNLFDLEQMSKLGFHYESIEPGKKSSNTFGKGYSTTISIN